MAAVASAPGPASALTPPSSSHGDDNGWAFSDANAENHIRDSGNSSFDHAHKPNSAFTAHDARSAPRTVNHDAAARKMRSADNLHSAKWSKNSDHSREQLPGLTEEEKANSSQFIYSQDQSKWIHRDKLARIETEELEAAGIFLPKARAPSRQRRSDSRLSHTTETEPTSNRLKKEPSSLEPITPEPLFLEPLSSTPSWDLRTPQEIAESEAEKTAYFTPNATGGSRIPVAKLSPVPISLGYLEHGSLAARQNSDEDDSLSYSKTRSRSASAAIRDSSSSNTPGAKRSITDTSPKKHVRKNSSGTSTRPVTRGKDSAAAAASRPGTRTGRSTSRAKHPEGDPPWMANTFKPDPRLPPDQQIPPFVAKRIAQEQMEKDGTFGDAYDKNFRPLNTNAFKPGGNDQEKGDEAADEEWPLKPAATTRPLMRSPSMYSTMPKISDKPPGTPIPSPRLPNTPQMQSMMATPQSTPAAQPVQKLEPEEIKKEGCGCCVVM